MYKRVRMKHLLIYSSIHLFCFHMLNIELPNTNWKWVH